MNAFCLQRDLLVWEPGVFAEAGLAHLALMRQVDAAVTATRLALAGGSLVESGVTAGMMAVLKAADESQTVAEIVQINGPLEATLSVLRADVADPATPPAWQGAVKLTVVNLAPLIAVVSEELLALLGCLLTDRVDASGVVGLKAATVFGTLAAAYRAVGPSKTADAKLALYTRLYQVARRAMGGVLVVNDQPRLVWGGMVELRRG